MSAVLPGRVEGPDLLRAIVAATRRIVDARRTREPMTALERRAAPASPRRSRFEAALGVAGRVNGIAECKRPSPSKGVIAGPDDPVRIGAPDEQVRGAA